MFDLYQNKTIDEEVYRLWVEKTLREYNIPYHPNGGVRSEYNGDDYDLSRIHILKGIAECSYEEFNYALRVGVTAPFYLTKLFLPYFSPGAAIVNISSSRDRMSQPQTESYTCLLYTSRCV